MDRKLAKNIDEYISWFPGDVQEILESMRQTIRDAAPEAVETISYAIPTFDYKGKHLVHFAAFQKHVSLFPGGEASEVFKDELTEYKVSKGTIQFPLTKQVPLELIRKITQYRVEKVDKEATK